MLGKNETVGSFGSIGDILLLNVTVLNSFEAKIKQNNTSNNFRVTNQTEKKKMRLKCISQNLDECHHFTYLRSVIFQEISIFRNL